MHAHTNTNTHTHTNACLIPRVGYCSKKLDAEVPVEQEMSRSKVFIAQRQSQKKSNFVKFSSFDQHSLELILFSGKETAKLSLQIGESANTNTNKNANTNTN